MSYYFHLHFLHRFRCFGMRITQIEVWFMIHRNKMEMCVWNLHTQNQRADPHASGCFFQCMCNFLCCLMNRCIIWFWKFVQFIDFGFWYYECVTELKWSDVEKCKRVFVLIEFIARNLARDDAGEDGGHGYVYK